MKRYLTLVMLFILSVLLISEWIYPFAELTELSKANWIILFITLSLGSFFLRLKYYWTIPLHIVMIIFVSGIYYAKGGILAGNWFVSFFQSPLMGLEIWYSFARPIFLWTLF